MAGLSEPCTVLKSTPPGNQRCGKRVSQVASAKLTLVPGFNHSGPNSRSAPFVNRSRCSHGRREERNGLVRPTRKLSTPKEWCLPTVLMQSPFACFLMERFLEIFHDNGRTNHPMLLRAGLSMSYKQTNKKRAPVRTHTREAFSELGIARFLHRFPLRVLCPRRAILTDGAIAIIKE